MRTSLIAIALVLLAGPIPPQERIEPSGSLRTERLEIRVVDEDGRPVEGARIEARQTTSDCRFGCNVFLWGHAPSPALEAGYRKGFADLFDFATLPFYWWSYEREPGRTESARIGEIAAWCAARGITTKGHPLLWNFVDPGWLPDDVDEVRELSLARAHGCVKEFAGSIDVWDVVNEATHFDREGIRGVKQTRAWNEIGVVELIRAACVRARAANPKATLLINDYRTDAAYARLIEALREPDGGFPFDAIGIQSHMHGGAWSDERINEVCARFARFGLPLHFTEVTIVSGPRGEPWLTTPEGEARQALEVERFYRRLFEHPEVEAITWWDFSDRGAWQHAPAGLVREDMTPKPAYEVLRRLITEEWRTRVEGRTDAAGRFASTAFRGTYDLVYQGPASDAAPVTIPLVLTAGGVRWGPDFEHHGEAVRIVIPGSER